MEILILKVLKDYWKWRVVVRKLLFFNVIPLSHGSGNYCQEVKCRLESIFA